MFDIAWSEFLVVAVVALVVVGPRDLPALLRTVGKTIASLRRMAGEFQGQFNEAMREAELDGLKDEITGLKDGVNKMVGASPFQIARDELKNALTDKPKPTPSALAGEAPTGEAAQAPSALAPIPEIAPVDEPPAPKPGEFAAARRKEAAATPKTATKPKTASEPKPAPKPKAGPAAKSAAATPTAKPSPKPKIASKPKSASRAKSVNGSAHPASEAGEVSALKSAAKSRKPGASA